MVSINPFLREVIANPDDDQARLIYADYLEERGDPRGEFIRVQCELARCGLLSPLYEDLRLRAEELLEEHGEQWAEEVEQKVVKAEFERGFISTVTVLGRRLAARGETLFHTAPIEWVRMNRVGGAGEKMAASPALSHIRRLDLSALKIPMEDVSLLLRSPLLNSLVALNVNYMRTAWNGEFGKALAEMSSANKLESLSLRCTEPLRREFLPGLCSGGGFPQLRSLCFGADYDSRSNWNAIRNLPVQQLESLRITGSVNTELCENVARLPIGRLKRLSLANTQAPATAMRALAESGGMDHVEELDFTNCPMGLRATKVLFSEQRLTRCKILSLGHDALNRRTTPVAPLLSGLSRHPLPALLRLSLRGWGVGQLQALVKEFDGRGAEQPQLQSLALMGAELMADDLVMLANGRWTSALRALDVQGANLDDDARDWLERGEPAFPSLLRLDLSAGHHAGFAVGVTPVMYDARLAPWLNCTLPALQFLRMNWAGAGQQTLERLATRDLPELRVVEILETKLPLRAVKKLLDSSRLPQLRQVIVSERLNRHLAKAGLGERLRLVK